VLIKITNKLKIYTGYEYPLRRLFSVAQQSAQRNPVGVDFIDGPMIKGLMVVIICDAFRPPAIERCAKGDNRPGCHSGQTDEKKF